MEQQSKIAVCFALAEEAGPFKKLCPEGVPVFLTGIGRDNAAQAARRFLASHSPELLLTCGFAGGLIPELKVGDVVFEIPFNGTQKANAQTAFPSSPGGIEGEGKNVETKLMAAGAKPAKIFCADRVAVTAREKKQLCEQTGADAAEMESGVIQSLCRERGLPCVTVRVISDAADEDLPLDFNKFLKEDKSVDMAKLALAMARTPWKIGAMMELQKKTKLAAQRLAEVLKAVIG